MSTHFHAIVWIDHLEARIFHVGRTGDSEMVLHSHLPTQHIHHKANTIGSGHVAPDQYFFAEVMKAISDAGEIIIIGPSSARTEFAGYLREQDPAIGHRIVAVEASDHPTDGQIVARAKQQFGLAPARAGNVGRSHAG